MMKDEQYAFPHTKVTKLNGSQGAHRLEEPGQGMTLRDYFAAKAMQGILADDSNNIAGIEVVAYEIADRMLEALQLKKKP